MHSRESSTSRGPTLSILSRDELRSRCPTARNPLAELVTGFDTWADSGQSSHITTNEYAKDHVQSRNFYEGSHQILGGGLVTPAMTVANVGSSLLSGGLRQAGSDLLDGGANSAYQIGKAGQHLAQVPGDLGAWAGQKTHGSGPAAYGMAGSMLHNWLPGF